MVEILSARLKIAFWISVAVHCAAIPLVFRSPIESPGSMDRGILISVESPEKDILPPAETPLPTPPPQLPVQKIKPLAVAAKPVVQIAKRIETPPQPIVDESFPSQSEPEISESRPAASAIPANVEIENSPPSLPETPAASPPLVVASAEPDYRKNPPPDYPSLARRKKQEGLVILIVTVNTNGVPLKVEIKQGSGFSLLDNAAFDAVSRWQFEPAKVNQNPIVSVVEIPISFRLSK
jgi:protein TonB